MPTWRKLHTKTVESFDVNDMPDDFTRLLWVLLPTQLCQFGRGPASPAWVRSNVFPMRGDVTLEMIAEAMAWYENRGMIRYYDVQGREYFHIPTWRDYQGDTSREATSSYPAPPDLEPDTDLGPPLSDPPPPTAGPTHDQLATNSRPTQVPSSPSSGTDVDVDVDTEVEEDTDALGATRAPPEMPPDPSELTVQQIKALTLSDEHWRYLRTVEPRGKNRKSVITHAERMLNRPPPALLAYQKGAEGFPKKSLWNGIIRVVGEKPDDVEFWRQVVVTYVGLGWNPLNIVEMLGWYKKRTLPHIEKPGKGTRRPQQSTPADFARSEYATPTDTPTRAPPTEAERIWSEVIAMWSGAYPHLGEIRAIPGDATDAIMLSGNRAVVEPVKARLMEQLARSATAAAGRPLEIRWVGDAK